MIVRIHGVVPVDKVTILVNAIQSVLGEDWSRAFQSGPRLAPNGTVVEPDPCPGYATFYGWQGELATLKKIIAAAKGLGLDRCFGRALAEGIEDSGPNLRVELGPDDVPQGIDATDPRESLARIIQRVKAATGA